jgi:hypothetical protein
MVLIFPGVFLRVAPSRAWTRNLAYRTPPGTHAILRPSSASAFRAMCALSALMGLVGTESDCQSGKKVRQKAQEAQKGSGGDGNRSAVRTSPRLAVDFVSDRPLKMH